MIGAMSSGVSGLKSHQAKMDVISNNIANINTTAFKSSTMKFQDVYSQTLSKATSGNGDVGGTNPMQVGAGVKIGSINTNFAPATTESTGARLDVAIEGDGFFVVSDGADLYFTRDGSFALDSNNYLVNANGLYVLDIDGDLIETDGFTEVSINSEGQVTGLDEFNVESPIAQIGLASFVNPSGLSKAGGNLYIETQNSGEYNASVLPGSPGVGYLRSGELELSNVDLAQEFTSMITTQRGYQANSRIITTADSMLEELVNLKR